MLYPERITLPLAAGTSDRIAAVLLNDEERVAFIREAIEREIDRRTAANSKRARKAE